MQKTINTNGFLSITVITSKLSVLNCNAADVIKLKYAE